MIIPIVGDNMEQVGLHTKLYSITQIVLKMYDSAIIFGKKRYKRVNTKIL